MSSIAELMQRRMGLIEKLAALNSKQLSNTLARSGAELELLACIEAIGESKVAPPRRADLEARYERAAEACVDCERNLNTLTDELNALDQQLGQTGSAP